MEYKDDFFYTPLGGHNAYDLVGKGRKSFSITQADIDKIKTLTHFKDSSSYYDNVPMITWRLIDNPQIKDKDELSRLFVCMQFISMIGDINPSHNIKPYHLDLLRSLYLEIDTYTEPYNISMGYKRPFGNSFVIGDVEESMRRYPEPGSDYVYIDEDEQDDQYEKDYTKETEAFVEFVEFLPKFFQDFELRFRSFVHTYRGHLMDWGPSVDWSIIEGFDGRHSYLRDWTLDPAVIRGQKIDSILL